MTLQENASPEPSLSDVKERIDHWRTTREKPGPMPEALWAAAADLSKVHSVSKIANTLSLNYTALKNRVHPEQMDHPVVKEHPPAFIELGIGQAPSISECMVEMENTAGAKMRMHFRGKTDVDLLELADAFWRKGS